FSYGWSNQATGPAVSGLSAGNYFVTITDGNGCVHVDTFNITQPAQIAIQVTATNVQCNGEANGAASASATGGNGGFSITWSDNSTGNNLAGLAAGNYSLTVTDANSCSSSASFAIDEPETISINTTSSSVSCFGLSDANANAVPSGGMGSFSYLWCNGDTTHNASALGAGTCAVIVTDENGCTASASVTIQQPAQLQITTSTTNGAAAVDAVTGGAAPYTYAWSNGATTQTISGVEAGNYVVTVTDNNGCTAASGATVLQTSVTSVNGDFAFSIYPNPATNRLTLTINKADDKTTLEVKNILGQVLSAKNITTTQTHIDVSSLANGVYLLEVKQDGKRYVKQFVVNK
ncbi:MAG TPA: T9SS type A sorting domain-containing protein, partial [Chitinophagales bacterium]|nr:T9SS type A sorting domain-containing protein [Chitinophagales bacterium]